MYIVLVPLNLISAKHFCHWQRLVEEVKQHAYKNLNDLKPLPIDTTIHGLVETSSSVQTAQYGGQDQARQPFDFPIAQQGTLYVHLYSA